MNRKEIVKLFVTDCTNLSLKNRLRAFLGLPLKDIRVELHLFFGGKRKK